MKNLKGVFIKIDRERGLYQLPSDDIVLARPSQGRERWKRIRGRLANNSMGGLPFASILSFQLLQQHRDGRKWSKGMIHDDELRVCNTQQRAKGEG